MREAQPPADRSRGPRRHLPLLFGVSLTLVGGCVPSARPAGVSGGQELSGKAGPAARETGDAPASDHQPPPPAALSAANAGTISTGDQVTFLSLAESPPVCVAHRPDLRLPFASLTVASALRPEYRALLEAWLGESLSPWLIPHHTAPCATSLACGSAEAAELPSLTAAVLKPTQTSFYQSRPSGLARFSERLQRPGQRQLLLAELLSLSDAPLPSDLEQLPNRVTYVDLSKSWSALKQRSWWTFTAATPGNVQTALVELRASGFAQARTNFPSSGSDSPPSGASPRLEVGVDLDESAAGAILLWPRPDRGSLGSQANALPRPHNGNSRLELVTSSDATFIGWRIISPNKEELIGAVAQILTTSGNANRDGASNSQVEAHGLTREPTLDERCDTGLAQAPQGHEPVPAAPGVLLTGFSGDDDLALLEQLVRAHADTSLRYFQGTKALTNPPPASPSPPDPSVGP